MALAESLPPDASTASAGLGLRYIGDWVYAYSGDRLTDSNNHTTLLEFTTGTGLIVAKVQFNDLSGQADVFTYRIYLNDVVMNAYNTTGSNSGQNNPDPVLFMIFPPLTRVKCTGKTNQEANRNLLVAITGRVYGAV